MRHGVPAFALTPAAAVTAPMSGVRFGTGEAGPRSLRLFRLSGTRVVVTSHVRPAQLIVVRAAAAGTPVQVVTSRPQLWEPLLAHDRAAHTITAGETRSGLGGPTLIVDDRPVEARGSVEIGPWQCRLDIRARWTPTEIGSFVHTDLAIFGTVAPELTGRIASAFGLPAAAARGLSALDGDSFAIARRGRIEYVTLDATPAERQLVG